MSIYKKNVSHTCLRSIGLRKNRNTNTQKILNLVEVLRYADDGIRHEFPLLEEALLGQTEGI